MARMTKGQRLRIAMEKNIKQMEESMKNQPSQAAAFLSCTSKGYEDHHGNLEDAKETVD